MKNKLQLSGKIGLGSLLAIAVYCCAFCQPFDPDTTCTAIPANARNVFKVDNLEALLQSPICDQLDNALGAGNTLEALLTDSGWSKWVEHSEITVADIPFRQPGLQKTWVASAWVGWRSPWLRWKLEHTRNKHFHFIGKHLVWPVWQYDAPDIARGMSLTFALTDRLVIACLSENPTDILPLLDAYDQRIPSANPHR